MKIKITIFYKYYKIKILTSPPLLKRYPVNIEIYIIIIRYSLYIM